MTAAEYTPDRPTRHALGPDTSRPTGTPPPYDWARGKRGRGKDGVCRHEFIPSPFSSLGICRHCAWQRWAK